ncbi:uncharacterized protein LOC129756637 [Uranotaenia lowii]|uniref:uncharacterized protein LOC129756637 n=1 Tax=Uranotaenia lowii TaxID=190385 RepID=UPI002479D73D|nr:uncharacterized protein LOC129756637 [Uranotaenia lowii]
MTKNSKPTNVYFYILFCWQYPTGLSLIATNVFVFHFIICPFSVYLQLPDVQQPREIFLKSEKGEIDVFLCPESSESSPNNNLLAGTSSSNGSLIGTAIGNGNSRPGPDPLLENIDPLLSPLSEKLFSPKNRLRGVWGKPFSSAQRNLCKALFGSAPVEVKMEPMTEVLDSHLVQSANKPVSPLTALHKELELLSERGSPPGSNSSNDISNRSNDGVLSAAIKKEKIEDIGLGIKSVPELTMNKYASLNDSKLSPEALITQAEQMNVMLKGSSAKSTPVNMQPNDMMAVYGNCSPFSLQYSGVTGMDAFMPLEPLDSGYNFSLDPTEGVFDLFDLF